MNYGQLSISELQLYPEWVLKPSDDALNIFHEGQPAYSVPANRSTHILQSSSVMTINEQNIQSISTGMQTFIHVECDITWNAKGNIVIPLLSDVAMNSVGICNVGWMEDGTLYSTQRSKCFTQNNNLIIESSLFSDNRQTMITASLTYFNM